MNKTADPDLIAAKTRNENAAADIKEFKLAIMRKEYVAVSAVNKKLASDVGKVRTKLLGLSSRIAPQLAGQIHEAEEIKRLIDAIVYEALSDLADHYEEGK